MIFSASVLRQAIERDAPPSPYRCIVALSGGADSAALLAAAAELRDVKFVDSLRAVHVDHGLQSAAADLRARAEQTASQCGVEIEFVDLALAIEAGHSLEAAARHARYEALADALRPQEILLTAHHADDQAETVLLQALRGAGSKGLAAMPALRPLGRGWHLRPLLEVGRTELQQYARARQLQWTVDPMNSDTRFERAYLRHEIWPRILQRWPGAAATLSRLAAHQAEIQVLLDERADEDLGRVSNGETLSVSALRRYASARRVNILRRFIALKGAALPSAVRLEEALRQLFDAKSDHMPAIEWGGTALRRYRDRVYLTARAPPALRQVFEWEWRACDRLALPDGLGTLRWVTQAAGLDRSRLPAKLTVRGRTGGEALRVARNASTQTLQHLCQQRGIVPWMRSTLPCILAGEELVAVGEYWLSATHVGDAEGIGFVWEAHPDLM